MNTFILQNCIMGFKSKNYPQVRMIHLACKFILKQVIRPHNYLFDYSEWSHQIRRYNYSPPYVRVNMAAAP